MCALKLHFAQSWYSLERILIFHQGIRTPNWPFSFRRKFGFPCRCRFRCPKLYFADVSLGAPGTVSWWKLQPGDLQDEYGKLAPTVTKQREMNSDCGPEGAKLSNEARQSTWFGAALEELAQMCGAFLAATRTPVTPLVDPTSNLSCTGAPHLSITFQVGDSLNFCDALLAATSSPYSTQDSPSGCRSAAEHPGVVFEPLSFQQGSLQPLHLRADVFRCPPEFDVISTSNLAEHLGGCCYRLELSTHVSG